jgi:hypothetical protein
MKRQLGYEPYQLPPATLETVGVIDVCQRGIIFKGGKFPTKRPACRTARLPIGVYAIDRDFGEVRCVRSMKDARKLAGCPK